MGYKTVEYQVQGYHCKDPECVKNFKSYGNGVCMRGSVVVLGIIITVIILANTQKRY